MTLEMESIKALNDFKNSLKSKTALGRDSFKFKGLVTYTALDKEVTEILDVILVISGFQPEIKLDIDFKGKIIVSDIYHLDFNPRFENTLFKFDFEKNTIIIEGKNSPKLSNYKVTISEI